MTQVRWPIHFNYLILLILAMIMICAPITIGITGLIFVVVSLRTYRRRRWEHEEVARIVAESEKHRYAKSMLKGWS